MLKQRILTAIVLLLLLLPALFYPAPEPFAALALLLIAAAAWEWARLTGLAQGAALACSAACVLACLAAWALGWLQRPSSALWIGAGTAWLLGGAALLRLGVAGWPTLPAALRLCGGLLALALTWLATAQARVIGINFLLSILALVWTADIAAYFAGRAFGQRLCKTRLAASISPGKSWEGVWGGMFGVLLLGAAWIAADAHWQVAVPSLYSRLWAGLGWLLPLALLLLTAFSVVGDLVESLVKRSAGVKDSSGLLPGHGGVLDRVDALLPTLPLALMLVALSAKVNP